MAEEYNASTGELLGTTKKFYFFVYLFQQNK